MADEGSDVRDEKGIAHLPGAHENRSSGKLATSLSKVYQQGYCCLEIETMATIPVNTYAHFKHM